MSENTKMTSEQEKALAELVKQAQELDMGYGNNKTTEPNANNLCQMLIDGMNEGMKNKHQTQSTMISYTEWMKEWPESQKYDDRFLRENFIKRIQEDAIASDRLANLQEELSNART